MHYVLLRILILFKDKKLLVTGGTGSIGASICNYFNNNGCKEIFATNLRHAYKFYKFFKKF